VISSSVSSDKYDATEKIRNEPNQKSHFIPGANFSL